VFFFTLNDSINFLLPGANPASLLIDNKGARGGLCSFQVLVLRPLPELFLITFHRSTLNRLRSSAIVASAEGSQ